DSLYEVGSVLGLGPILVQGLFQVLAGGIVFRVGDAHALMGIFHVLAGVLAGSAGGAADEIHQVFLQILDGLLVEWVFPVAGDIHFGVGRRGLGKIVNYFAHVGLTPQ